MRDDKNLAIILRKEGKSYDEIRDRLGIPKATLSDWFSKEKWSKEKFNQLKVLNIEVSKNRIIRLNKIRGENLEKVYETARREAREDFEKLKYSSLFIAGITIYWGEGDKASKNGFRISNSDPILIKVFLQFLRKACGTDEKRIRAGLLVYPDLNKNECEIYWSKAIGLDKKNFTKSIVIQGKHRIRKVSHGICTLSFSSRFLKEKMLIWMSLLGQELQN